MRDRTALKNREKNLTAAILKRQCRQRLEQIERHIDALDAEIANLIADNATLVCRHEILASIAGVGTLTADQLSPPRLNSAASRTNRLHRSVALHPSRASPGCGKARASYKASVPTFRRALYRPALVAARFNPTSKPNTSNSSSR